jgi:hypothetical protein
MAIPTRAINAVTEAHATNRAQVITALMAAGYRDEELIYLANKFAAQGATAGLRSDRPTL